jgi:hypothetical protein
MEDRMTREMLRVTLETVMAVLAVAERSKK